jgi:hypothetical protein
MVPHEMLRKLGTCLLAVGLIVVIGCGDEVQTVTTSSLSDSQFVKRAEEICARERLEGLRYQPPDNGQSASAAVGDAIGSTLLPSLQEAIDELYELGAPKEMAGRTEALLVALQHGVDAAEALDIPTTDRVEKLMSPAGKLARKAGLESCVYS